MPWRRDPGVHRRIRHAPAGGRVLSAGQLRQASGKIVTVFAAEADFQPGRIASNTFPLEWPRGSGVVRNFPEIDDAAWVSEPEARTKLVRGQLPVLDALQEHLLRDAG